MNEPNRAGTPERGARRAAEPGAAAPSGPPPEPVKKSDLGPRTLSAVVMLLALGAGLWLGGLVWTVIVALVALGVLWEWNGLTSRFAKSALSQALWLFVGVIYIGTAALALIHVRDVYSGLDVFVGYLAPIFAVDIGAYFIGRAIGGPKIAPSISPSKTWAGLFGGMVGAFAVCLFVEFMWPQAGHFALGGNGSFGWPSVFGAAVYGAVIAIVAQMGDFFESWMKRSAGVKDSGKLIPGHGGIFDRTDGLIAVFFMLGVGLAVVRSLG